jgi:hypothetical protein
MRASIRAAFSALVFVCVTYVLPARADNIVPNDRMKAIGEYIWSPAALNPLNDRSSRINFASLVAKVCGDYRNAVPTLTPDEKTWLETEMKQTGKRMEAAVASSLYARYSLASTFNRCIDAANGITHGDDRPSMWIWLSTIMIEDDLFDTFGRIGVDGIGNEDVGIVNSLFRRIATAIMIRVIRPRVE